MQDKGKMKYSYELDGVDYTVVKTKNGRIVEVRRGDLTGEYLRAAGRRTWASEADWKAELPTGTVLTRYDRRTTSNPRLNRLLEYCGSLRVYDTVAYVSDYDGMLSHIRYLQGEVALAREYKLEERLAYCERRIAECKEELLSTSREPTYRRTEYRPIFYFEEDDMMSPVYVNCKEGLMLYCIGDAWDEIPVGCKFWIPLEDGYMSVIIDDVPPADEPGEVCEEPVYVPSPVSIPEINDEPTQGEPTKEEFELIAKKRWQMLNGLAFFFSLAYRLYKP